MAEAAEDRRLTPEQSGKLLAIGRHLPRERHQDGHVRKEGKHARWKGHYFEYEQVDGVEVRRHRKVDLGPVTELTKTKAKEKLRDYIATKSLEAARGAEAAAVPAPNPETEPEMTLRRFWEVRYRPMREPHWKESSRYRTVFFIERYVVGPFADVPLKKLDKYSIQMHLNEMAAKFSHSTCLQFRVYIKAMLEEAVDMDLITKDPARKLDFPQTRAACQRFLTTEEIADLVAAAPPRDQLIIRMFMVLGLRPGELFALRRDDVKGQRLRVDESVWKTGTVGPKNTPSIASVWMPKRIAKELADWMGTMEDQRPEAFVFASKRGTPMSHHNFLSRNLKSIVAAALKKHEDAGEETPEGYLVGVNHRAFRTTCATWAQKEGSVKDVQAMLRHSKSTMTVDTYMQPIPESVRRAVEGLDKKLRRSVHKCSQAKRRSTSAKAVND